MEERARALARVPDSERSAGALLEVTTFTLNRERYAIEAHHVREVTRLTEYTPVPAAPSFLVGLMNLRGEVLTVIDLRKFLGIDHPGVTDLSRVIVLGHEHAEFGILADAVHEVTSLRSGDVLEPIESVGGIGRECLRGVTQDALIVLDGAALLHDGRLFIDQQVSEVSATLRVEEQL